MSEVLVVSTFVLTLGGRELQVRTRYIEINKNNTTMTGDNRPLVTDDPLKFDK